ncbi:MAG: DUF3990 domain-containing protein [Saccharofermentans sp.]|nr:DUF3990 domain-containing protein [Saccharofermentans sp.]
MDDIILYHGSRGGIIGDIQPESRESCDFGKGFYMGSDKMQASSLVSEKREPVLYTLRLKLSEIPDERILVLDGNNWLNGVLSNRRYCDEFNKLKLAKRWRNKLNHYDVVVGKIADDRMLDALERFASYGMTDVALIECLQSVNYGFQYVAKTEYACSKIEVVSCMKLQGVELEEAQRHAKESRRIALDAVDQAIRNTRGKGRYLDEIVREELNREKQSRER